MSNISIIVGKRIRNYRSLFKLSQEKLGELAGLHSSYIGQLERGEKNPTIETMEKISRALNIPLSKIFDKIGDTSEEGSRDIPSECYDFIASKSKGEQELLYKMLIEMDKYKNK